MIAMKSSIGERIFRADYKRRIKMFKMLVSSVMEQKYGDGTEMKGWTRSRGSI